jgi:hypothetical protein
MSPVFVASIHNDKIYSWDRCILHRQWLQQVYVQMIACQCTMLLCQFICQVKAFAAFSLSQKVFRDHRKEERQIVVSIECYQKNRVGKSDQRPRHQGDYCHYQE